jgi:NADPH-dependent 2,4-dienoyl-CoA reductase/sulfur reductase-like enzyme/peroxiredoxin family protein/rhodanese-related sulfurtransferase/TusA-related sulfurtransferase
MNEAKRVVIIGGVAGGAAAAARMRRLDEHARIVMFERGVDISFANCGMPYHVGGVIAQRQKLLVQTAEAFGKRFNVQVRARTEVVRIDRQAKTVAATDLNTGSQIVEPYDYLVLSPGAEPIRPPLPGIDSKRVYTLRGMADMDAIKREVDETLKTKGNTQPGAAVPQPSRAVIVGGGYIGLEMAEALRGRGLEVAIVELAGQVFNAIDPEMASPIHQQLQAHGVTLRLGQGVAAFEDSADVLTVRLSGGDSLPCDLAILAIGVRPEVKLAREAGLEIGPTGGIAVDEHMRTSDANIYAVGDAAEVRNFVTNQPALVPLAGPANRQGRIAADNIAGRASAYKNTQGTAICKVFDLAVGMTGLSEKTLKKSGIAYEKVYVHPSSHASYYPGASAISLKLLFAPDGKILGAQAVGTDGVDKRIDVLAVALRAGLTVYDLENLELSYAPPYGSAKDVVNYAGFVAANALRGDVKLWHWDDVRGMGSLPVWVSPASHAQMLLDVRTPAEVEAGTIPGAKNIPLDDLRSRLAELPRDQEILAFCQVGLRGYLACRILSQNGFACRNLSGGYKTYLAGTGKCGAGGTPMCGTGILPVSSLSPAVSSSEQQEQQQQDRAGTALEHTDKTPVPPVKTVDATGLQCPGPIMKLKEAIGELKDGQALTIVASDCAFAADVKGWCNSTGNELQAVETSGKTVRATIVKRSQTSSAPAATTEPKAMNKKTIVVFSNDLDKVMAAFIIANGAAAMGGEVTMFFTFWGLNVLRKRDSVAVSKTLVERMFGWMMPRGPEKLTLSKMNMCGMGTAMMKGVMARKNIPALGELIQSARAAGVHLVACSMSMDVMGIRQEELIDGAELGGVAMYLDRAEQGNVNLFI